MRAPLVLSFRSAPEGGEVRTRPDLTDFYARWTKSRLVLLVHGYNCPVPEAEQAYAGFLSIQAALAADAPGGDFAPDRDFVEVFWKGDDWGPLGALYYGEAIRDAVASAGALAEVLRALALERAGGLDLQLVAHSLGTRLALELLRATGLEPRVRFNEIVFFAGATPTFMLADAQESHGLRRAYDGALRGGLLSLFSGADYVLGLAFPLGETFAGEGRFPVALGHAWFGLAPASAAQQENRNAGHGDYWGGNRAKPDCERFAGAATREYLGFTGAGARLTPAVASAARRPQQAQPAPARAPTARGTPSRDLG